MGVGLRLKQILRRREMTIKQLAEEAGIPLNTLYSITKRDSERVDSVILYRIAEVLGVSEDELHGVSVDYAKNLKLAREWRKFSQKDLADKMGIPVARIQQYESGERKPSKETWFSIADVFNLLPDELDHADELPTDGIELITEQDADTDRAEELKPLLLEYFSLLNEDGQYEAVRRMEELTLLPRYQRPDYK